MKVFISWSGELSNKIANILREWMPCVIQSIKPYVSSKDIDKGARWSTDIAQELKDSRFGIICVTKDNINAPWINFEAGALSKAMDKSNVAPFLFDIKRSEVNGPILQFQSTIFEKDDIKSLMITINGLCGEGGLSETHFERSFEKWYPALEEKLNAIPDIIEDKTKDKNNKTNNSNIIEEILEISRENQKLIRNTDLKIDERMDEFKKDINKQPLKTDDCYIDKKNEIRKKLDFIHNVLYRRNVVNDTTYKYMIILDFFRKDLPVIYDMGKDLIDYLDSENSFEKKDEKIEVFIKTVNILIDDYAYINNRSAYPLYRKGMDMLISLLDELQTEYRAYTHIIK